MHFKVSFVLVLVVVCAAHPGEPQSWLSTIFELVERLVGTEQTVKATDVKVNSLTDAVSVNLNKIVLLEEN